jgi:hypothetical protein
MIDGEVRERVARIETKIDVLSDLVKEVKINQSECPARAGYLAGEYSRKRQITLEGRLFGWTGWIVAAVGILSQVFLWWTKLP